MATPSAFLPPPLVAEIAMVVELCKEPTKNRDAILKLVHAVARKTPSVQREQLANHLSTTSGQGRVDCLEVDVSPLSEPEIWLVAVSPADNYVSAKSGLYEEIPEADGAILWRKDAELVLTPYPLADFPHLVGQVAGRKELFFSTTSEGRENTVFRRVFVGVRQEGEGWIEFFSAPGGGLLLGEDYILTQRVDASGNYAWTCNCSWTYQMKQELWLRDGESFIRVASRHVSQPEAIVNNFLGAAGVSVDGKPGVPCLSDAAAPSNCGTQLHSLATSEAVASAENLGLKGATIKWSFEPRQFEEYLSWNAIPAQFRAPAPATSQVFEIETNFLDGTVRMLRIELNWTSTNWRITSVALVP